MLLRRRRVEEASCARAFVDSARAVRCAGSSDRARIGWSWTVHIKPKCDSIDRLEAFVKDHLILTQRSSPYRPEPAGAWQLGSLGSRSAVADRFCPLPGLPRPHESGDEDKHYAPASPRRRPRQPFTSQQRPQQRRPRSGVGGSVSAQHPTPSSCPLSSCSWPSSSAPVETQTIWPRQHDAGRPGVWAASSATRGVPSCWDKQPCSSGHRCSQARRMDGGGHH